MVQGKKEKRYTSARVYIVLKAAIPLVLLSDGIRLVPYLEEESHAISINHQIYYRTLIYPDPVVLWKFVVEHTIPITLDNLHE
jgi:hypothetical protein